MILEPLLFSHMQAAVDIVATSPHPTNKIAATLAGADGAVLSRTNDWPASIAAKIGTYTDIGNASGTIHAETACILAAGQTEGASLFVTDPPCPNCMKNMAEAGIRSLYIDHKGFDKDFARRRGDTFAEMSLRIAERAGISVFVIYRKEQRLETVLDTPEDYHPLEEFPMRIAGANPVDFHKLIRAEHDFFNQRPFALALAHNKNGQTFHLSACAHPAIGYSHETLESADGKYNFVLEPVNRMIMGSARRGLHVSAGYFYSSRVPTARELINMVGAGITTITIGDPKAARDIFGPKALKQLTEAKILSVIERE
jgi:deoxycytidylate deaminase